MKYTLLDLVQTILSSTDGDEVNSINDNVEAQQIARIVRTVYFDIVDRANLPEQYTLFQLNPSLDSTKPILMSLPSTLKSLKWIKYNVATIDNPELTMQDIMPLPLEDYLRMMYSLNTTDPNVETMSLTVNSNTFSFLYYNDRAPTYYTSFDDGNILFDSFDSAVDSTLQGSKTQCYGLKTVPWSMVDTFIPDLDDAQFSLLINEAKSLAFQETKQTQHPIADRNSRRGWTNVQKQRKKIFLESDFLKLPSFGRIR